MLDVISEKQESEIRSSARSSQNPKPSMGQHLLTTINSNRSTTSQNDPQAQKMLQVRTDIFNLLKTIGTARKLKNMMFYVHQNFLVLSEIILDRLPKECGKNIWGHSLLAQILNKKAY